MASVPFPAPIRPSGPPDPRSPSRWHRLWVVPRSGEHHVYALGDSVVWVWRHYCSLRKAFVYCRSHEGHCLLCANGHGREKSGYLPVLVGEEQRTMVVTSGAWLHSQSLQRGDGALRGYRIYAVRLHPRANGPLRVWLPGDHMDGRKLPAPWDVLAELTTRYGSKAADIDQERKELG